VRSLYRRRHEVVDAGGRIGIGVPAKIAFAISPTRTSTVNAPATQVVRERAFAPRAHAVLQQVVQVVEAHPVHDGAGGIASGAGNARAGLSLILLAWRAPASARTRRPITRPNHAPRMAAPVR